MLWDSRPYWNLLSSLIWGQCSSRESGVTLHLVSADAWGGRGPLFPQSGGRGSDSPLGLHWYPPGLAGREGTVTALHVVSTDTAMGREPCSCQHQSPEPPLGHLFSNPRGERRRCLIATSRDEKSAPCWQAVKLGCTCYGLVRVEVRACHSVFSGMGLDNTIVFPMMSG